MGRISFVDKEKMAKGQTPKKIRARLTRLEGVLMLLLILGTANLAVSLWSSFQGVPESCLLKAVNPKK